MLPGKRNTELNLKFNNVIYVCSVVIYSLTIEVIMKCGRGAYGPDCGRVCVSNSESYFTCDSKGFKSCYKGILHSNIPDDIWLIFINQGCHLSSSSKFPDFSLSFYSFPYPLTNQKNIFIL